MMQSLAWLKWTLVPIGLLVVAMGGMRWYLGVARRAVHANPQGITSVTRPAPPPEWSGAVDRARGIIRASIAEQHLPGLSVAVGAGGQTVWAEGFGWADIEARLPVTPDTRFRMGTLSTVLTSAAVGALVEKGRLRLEDEIQSHVPQFPKGPRPVTLRHLMAQVSGVSTDEGEEGPLYRQRCEHPVEALPHFAKDAWLFPPGTQYRESKYGWVLVSAAVETAAEQPLLAFMRDRVFGPLGMSNTGAESAVEENPERVGEPEEDPPPATLVRHLILKPLGLGGTQAKRGADPATVYGDGFGPSPLAGYGLHVMRIGNLSCYAGSMAFFSTPTDLVRFGLAIHGGKILQPATTRLLQTSQQLASGRETGYGLGWEVGMVTLAGKSAQTAGHDGKLRDQRVVTLTIFRETGLVVAVMANLANADTRALALEVAEAFAARQ